MLQIIAPNAADEGDLWFDSESGRLYIWYINTNDQGQWVDASPDGGGDANGSDFVSKVDTASQNIVSDLTLGTDKITLDASNGSAEFADGGVFNAYLISDIRLTSSTATGNATYVGKNATANTDASSNMFLVLDLNR